jgi:hypothetical protein
MRPSSGIPFQEATRMSLFGASLAGVRVLVVDDSSDGREMFALVLEHTGASVITKQHCRNQTGVRCGAQSMSECFVGADRFFSPQGGSM